MLSYFGIVSSGHLLDLPNGILGMVYYVYIFLRSISQVSIIFHPKLNFIISSLAMASSLFLGKKLIALREICVVCITTHMINTIVFYRTTREILSGNREVNKLD